jgi:LDH2 family malate/lactate/ureidoglycolate dehydrogenase
VSDCGFLLTVIDPGLLTDADDFRRRAAEYAALVRDTRPRDPGRPVRVPFDRSAAERERRQARGVIEVSDEIHTALTQAATAGGLSGPATGATS